MAFASIGPMVDKVIEKSVEFVPVIGPGLKYVKTAITFQKIFSHIFVFLYF